MTAARRVARYSEKVRLKNRLTNHTKSEMR